MFSISRIASSPKATVFQLFLKKSYCQTLSPLSLNITIKKSDTEPLLRKTAFHESIKRSLHVTLINKDIEVGLKAVGSGIACTALLGSACGIGIIFGNLLNASARNPSLQNILLRNGIIGATLCESVGLFGLAVAFVLIFA